VAAGVREQVNEAGCPAIQDGLYLELAGKKRGQAPLSLPVEVTALSAGGVVLKTAGASDSVDALHLEGRETVIRVPQLREEPLGQIQGRVLWVRAGEGKEGEYAIALELNSPGLRVRKVLEDRLETCPRDIKELWDQWDRVHARRLLPSPDQAVYLVAVGAMAGGATFYFLGPDTLKLYGGILAIYGCLMMAARSAWAMWQARTVPEE